MDVQTLGIVGGLGAVAGALPVLAYFLSERSTSRPVAASEPTISEGVTDLLGTIPSAWVVLDSEADVLRAAPLAFALGLVRAAHDEHPRLAHPELIRSVARIGRAGGLVDEEITLPRGTGGGDCVLSVRIATFGPRLVVLLADDLTRTIRLEATRRDFVANISHELKTPVGALSVLAETMEEAADDPVAVRRFAGRMGVESARLSRLVKDIIDLSRVQAESSLTDGAEISVDDLVAQGIAQTANVASSSDITVRTAGGQGLSVFGSDTLLTTALVNLLANAIAYSGPGTTVGVGVKRIADVVEIAVRDQGIGISSVDLPRVFERFYRVDRARSRATGGTGLGLAIVKHIAQDHGGEVSAWSVPGAGSTFTLRLPALHLGPEPEERREALAAALLSESDPPERKATA